MKIPGSLLLLTAIALAQQPAQQQAQQPAQLAAQRPAMRPIPPVGVEVPAADRTELENGLRRLKPAMEKLKDHPLLPDVMIYHEAVRYALQYNEFFKLEEVFKAKLLLQHGEERARQLAEGRAPWTTAKRYVVLNSGFTFREFDYLNNARQTPKLPDDAVVDITTPPDFRYSGKIVLAGFFNEDWGL
jgi:hypothetical protein